MDFYKSIISIIYYMSQITMLKLFDHKRGKLEVNASAYLVYLQIFEDLHVTYDGPNKLNAIRSHLGGFLGML